MLVFILCIILLFCLNMLYGLFNLIILPCTFVSILSVLFSQHFLYLQFCLWSCFVLSEQIWKNSLLLVYTEVISPPGFDCKCVCNEGKAQTWATRTWFLVLWDFCSQTRHWSYCLMLMALQSETRLRTQLKNCFRSWRSVEFCRAALESHEPAIERSKEENKKFMQTFGWLLGTHFVVKKNA